MDLQKASMWKRISAGLFDGILLVMLVTLLAWLLSMTFGYDAHVTAWNDGCARYEQEYGVTFNISAQEYEALSDTQRQSYDTAYAALIADEATMHAYNMMANLSLLIATAAIAVAVLLLEFVVPLIFQNGQTLGKKIFSLGVMRTDAVKLTTLQLFVRTLLGRYTLEIMIPVYIVLMIIFGTLGLLGTVILAAFALLQVILMAATRENALLHDKLAGTVVVDIASQRIFGSAEELLEYQKRIHAERAARQTY